MLTVQNHIPDTIKFTTFLRNVAGVSASVLPDASVFIDYSFAHSLDLVNLDIGVAASQPTGWSPYEQAIYNLAAHLLIEFANDPSYAISAISWNNGQVSGSTTTPHSFLPGDNVRIIGVSPLAYSGVAPTTGLQLTDVPDTAHFGYPLMRNPGTSSVLPSAAIQGTFFAEARRRFKINSFVAGVVGNTSDLSTSVGLVVPDFLRNLTLDQMQLMKTPFGRAYLAIAQKYGPNVWGLT